MIICKNCGNEVDEHETYCNCCSHKIEESLENYHRSSVSKLENLNSKKRCAAVILVVCTVIVCLCIPILKSYNSNNNVALLKQSANSKKNNVITQIHYKTDKSSSVINKQVEKSKNTIYKKTQQKQL